MKNRKKQDGNKKALTQSIVFGFDRAMDEHSLLLFLRQFTDKKVLDVLLPRLQDQDIIATVDFLTTIMQKHFSEHEYHSLFLSE
jgi:hypothetical protein